MVKSILAPSLMCCDMLHMERDIRALEQAGVDMIHFDIMDTTFTTSTMLSPYILKQLTECTKLPLDIHIMSKVPEIYLEQILPYCKEGFVSIHAESTHALPYVMGKIREAGAHPSLALNAYTPITYVEEVAPYIDMILLVNAVAGITGPRPDIDDVFSARIRKTRQILDDVGKSEAWLEVDGNISKRNAKVAKKNGANVYVLGTASIFRNNISIEDAVMDFQKELEKEESYETSDCA